MIGPQTCVARPENQSGVDAGGRGLVRRGASEVAEDAAPHAQQTSAGVAPATITAAEANEAAQVQRA